MVSFVVIVRRYWFLAEHFILSPNDCLLQVLRNAFSLEFDPTHPPTRNVINVEPYTTLFSGKAESPVHPPPAPFVLRNTWMALLC